MVNGTQLSIMKQTTVLARCLALGCLTVGYGAEPALTIYNQDFAVVRDTVPLELKAGVNEVHFAGATAHVEPDSVILRDPSGKHNLRILEQNYRNDPVSQEMLLSLFEGKTLEFETLRTKDNTQVRELIPGKIIRSGFLPGGASEQPIIEVNGKLQFTLPGMPLFPTLGDDTVLKPAFDWALQSDAEGKLDAEVGYITGGFNWEADYNLVAPESGNTVDMVGWITMRNNSGKTFRDAKIKLMAGDVNRVQPRPVRMALGKAMLTDQFENSAPVSEKAFDEFHLYTLARPATLRDRESKQVEFVQAEHVLAPVVYIYDGAAGFGYGFYGNLNQDSGYGTECNKKVWVMREFVNAETNHLGIALPKGKLRFYRRDSDGQLEFTGEDTIDHTPRNELIRIKTGNAFDVVGERKRTEFHIDNGDKWLDESFELKLRNHKKESIQVRVVEHLYRWNTWTIAANSAPFDKRDSQTIEFRVRVEPDQERTINYKVHYTW